MELPPATTFTDTNPDWLANIGLHDIDHLASDTDRSEPNARVCRRCRPCLPSTRLSLSALCRAPSNCSAPPTVIATACRMAIPNGLQVSFSATGSCSIGSQIDDQRRFLSERGPQQHRKLHHHCLAGGHKRLQLGRSCIRNLHDPASGLYHCNRRRSTFRNCSKCTYGNTFSVSATSSAGLPVSFTATGPCTTSGKTTGVGLCTITASAPGKQYLQRRVCIPVVHHSSRP